MITNVIVWVFWCFLWLYDLPALAAEPDARQQQLMESAKKEGRMVFYTSVETEFGRALTSGFGAKYPFVKTDIYRSTHAKILSRMNVERKTGTYNADAVSVREFETYHLAGSRQEPA